MMVFPGNPEIAADGEATDRIAMVTAVQDALRRLIHDARSALRQDGKAFGLSYSQASALLILGNSETETQMSALADKLQLPASTVTSIIDALVDRNFVCRSHKPDDRRTVTADLTVEGAVVVSQLRAHNLELFAERFAVLDEAELEQFHTLLRRVVAPTRP